MKRILFCLIFIFQCHFLFAGIIVHNGVTHQYNVKGGEVYEGKIVIENTADHPQNVKIFLQDLRYDATGHTYYSKPSTHKTSNAGWIDLETNLLTLEAHEKRAVFYNIRVPDADLKSGSYWSVIMVEPTENYNPTEKKGSVTITSVVRYAIQIITDYQAGQLESNLKFKSLNIEELDDKRLLKIAMVNTGKIYCRPTITAELYNRDTGQRVGQFSSLAMGLLPYGNSKTFTIDISKVDPGKYKAVLIATDQENNAFALKVKLQIK